MCLESDFQEFEKRSALFNDLKVVFESYELTLSGAYNKVTTRCYKVHETRLTLNLTKSVLSV